MQKYKTLLTDYEGIQTALDTHSEMGWNVFSVSVDTWRKTLPAEATDTPAFVDLNPGDHSQEYTASYYLIVFERSDLLDSEHLLAAAEETFPLSQIREFGES